MRKNRENCKQNIVLGIRNMSVRLLHIRKNLVIIANVFILFFYTVGLLSCFVRKGLYQNTYHLRKVVDRPKPDEDSLFPPRRRHKECSLIPDSPHVIPNFSRGSDVIVGRRNWHLHHCSYLRKIKSLYEKLALEWMTCNYVNGLFVVSRLNRWS